jgi:ribosomal protein S18 acetylase RimI-like enzyme
MSDAGLILLRPAVWPRDKDAVRALFREYAASLDGSLAAVLCLQGFEGELADLPGAYRQPEGNVLLAEADGKIVGVVALRPLEPGICEMKRLYVQPEYQRTGIGARLAQAVIEAARRYGYAAMRLDTHVSMGPAIALYRRLGFREIPRYYGPPNKDIIYFERALK